MSRSWRWGLFSVVVLAGLFLGLTTIIEIVTVAKGHYNRGSTTGSMVGATIILGALTFFCAWMARLLEHSARTATSLRQSAGTSFNRAPGSPRLQSNHSSKLELIFLLITAVVMVAATIDGFSGWEQSKETQAHGIAVTGTVTSIISVYHSERYGGYDTYNLSVQLPHKVEGEHQVVVTTNFQSPPAQPGQVVSLLVDPKDPSYAELPGDGVSGPSGWVLPPVVGAVLILAIMARSRAYQRRRAARLRAAPQNSQRLGVGTTRADP